MRSGAISIFGAIIHASSKLYRVYAPSTHAIPPIRSVPNPYGTGDPPTEVSFFSCGSRLRLLKQISPKFGRIWNGRKGHRGSNRSFVNVSQEQYKTIIANEFKLQTSAEDSNGRSLCLLNLPSNWQTTIARIQSVSSTQHLAVMVCGLKGAGKSTFCRILANALLSKTSMSSSNSTQIIQSVAFMDLDPGQPEYSPSGELSLLSLKDFHLGPPFTHPVPGSGNTVIRSHHFGHLSPKENSEYYHHCVLDLYQKYRKKMASSPLIVNYSSWIQSSGLELLTGLIKDVDLSDMIYMSSTGPEEVVDALQQAVIRRDVPLHQLTSQASQVPTRTAADLRMMSTLSYFHVGSIEAGNIRWNTSPLSDQIPLIARYGGLDSDILAVMVLGDAQNMQFLESMLEGCVVGVVVLEDDAGIPRNNAQVDHWTLRTNIQGRSPHREEAHPSIRHTKSGIPYIRAEQHTIKPLDPARSYSLGQAIIRAIDTQVKAFQLLTPIPREIILQTKQQGRKIVLVRGRLDTPTWAYAERLMLDRHVKFRIENETGEREDNATDEVKEWALRQPWASVVKRGRSGSAKVRRVRRDLRYRSQPETA